MSTSATVMEVATQVAFYSALGLGVPIILCATRCVYILCKKEYIRHAFCKIFIASLISNSIAFCMLMHNLRFPGMGFFPGYYEAVKNGWWLPFQSYLTRIAYMLSLMFSFALSLNRVTSLYLHEKLNEKIWRYFFFLHLPLMILSSAILTVDIVLNKAEYVQAIDANGKITYRFVNYNIMRNWDSYYTIVECIADAVCNVLIILKFFRIRMGTAKRTSFENSLYLISFCSFFFHTAKTGMQIALRYNVFPTSSLQLAYLFNNAIYDATLLIPTVSILTLTKEIRVEFQRAIAAYTRCFCPVDEQAITVSPASTTSVHSATVTN